MENSTEEWRDVIGHEGRYQVSSHGRVRSFLQGKPKILRPKTTKTGYVYVALATGLPKPRTVTMAISRLVAAAFIPNPDDLAEVDHINGRKEDNRVENLQWIEHDWNVRKSQAYVYTAYHIDDPDNVMTFYSRRSLSIALGIHYLVIMTQLANNIPIPNKKGWVISSDRRRGFAYDRIKNARHGKR